MFLQCIAAEWYRAKHSFICYCTECYSVRHIAGGADIAWYRVPAAVGCPGSHTPLVVLIKGQVISSIDTRGAVDLHSACGK